jgi:manganese-dependent inorganic pyrophosphatase
MVAVPCRALLDAEPITVRVDDLVADISEQMKDIHYRAAVAVDGARRPVGLVTRSDLVDPRPRRVLLVDHPEHAQSVPGVEQAEIVEILDHHHVGSIETKVPVTATFDPVSATATVILHSPTTAERDRVAVEYLACVLAVEATELRREMFQCTSDVTGLPAEEILARDVKEYAVGRGRTISIAQIETVGDALLERRDELPEALRARREREGQLLSALMFTGILAKGSELLVAGDVGVLERACGNRQVDGVVDLPVVMSRKKQVAPRLLTAASR